MPISLSTTNSCFAQTRVGSNGTTNPSLATPPHHLSRQRGWHLTRRRCRRCRRRFRRVCRKEEDPNCEQHYPWYVPYYLDLPNVHLTLLHDLNDEPTCAAMSLPPRLTPLTTARPPEGQTSMHRNHPSHATNSPHSLGSGRTYHHTAWRHSQLH